MFENFLEDKISANILAQHWKDVYISSKIHNILLSKMFPKLNAKIFLNMFGTIILIKLLIS